MSGRRDIAAARCARRDATHSDAFEQRFLLRASHPLRETHMIVQKLKLQSMEWRGPCPLSMPGPACQMGKTRYVLCITIHSLGL